MSQLLNILGTLVLTTAYVSIPIIVSYSAYVIHLQRKKRDARTHESDDDTTEFVEEVQGKSTAVSVTLPDIELKELKRSLSMPSLHVPEQDDTELQVKSVSGDSNSDTSDQGEIDQGEIDQGEIDQGEIDQGEIDQTGSEKQSTGDFTVKQSVVAASTTDVALSFITEGTLLDNITLFSGDRILLKDQRDASENGIYIVQDFGAPPVRSDDYKLGSDTSRCYIYVENGSKNGSTGWIAHLNGVVGVHPVYLVEFSGVQK